MATKENDLKGVMKSAEWAVLLQFMMKKTCSCRTGKQTEEHVQYRCNQSLSPFALREVGDSRSRAQAPSFETNVRPIIHFIVQMR